jgi:outer membrane murein-binding lipoprotein Lpp
MQIDKPNIKAIVNEVIDEHPTIQRMATQIGGLDTRVGGLETDVGTLKTDVAALKTDVAELKTDVAELKTDVAVLKTDLVEFKGEFKVFARTTNYSINQLNNSTKSLRLLCHQGCARSSLTR